MQESNKDVIKIGQDYLEALKNAEGAHTRVQTNDGDNYDPCDHTKTRVRAEFLEATINLALATKNLLKLAPD